VKHHDSIIALRVFALSLVIRGLYQPQPALPYGTALMRLLGMYMDKEGQ
jgi:hypothetical protein